MNALLVLSFLVLTTTQGPRSASVPVYDGRSLSGSPDRLVGFKNVEKFFKREIVSAARRAWRGKSDRCDSGNDARIIGTRKGSFTKPNSNQVVILYQFCSTAHNFALDGIAITEANRVVAHVIYEGAWDAAVGVLPDINRNGLSEIIIDSRGTNMGETSAGISIIELSGKTITKFGQSATYSDSCGATSASGAEAYALYAKPGTLPVFYRAAFERSCKRNAKWRKSATLGRLSLEEDTIEYQRIR